MNNILEEITYSDGRMDNVVKSLDTPAKLKLRARTYEGINKNLSKRRGTTTSTAFSIPNAFMAIDGASSNDGGNGYTITSPELNVRNGSSKRLRLNPAQIKGINQYMAVHEPVAENATDSVTNDNNQNPQEESAINQPENVVVSEVVVPEETPEIEQEAVQTEDVVGAVRESVPPIVDPLDAAREKVLNTQPVLPGEENVANDKIEQAEETDVFEALKNATSEYTKVDEELKKSNQKLIEAKNDLEDSKSNYRKIEDEIQTKEAQIQTRYEAIDLAAKEKQAIEEQIKDIETKTAEKIKLVKLARDQKLKEKHDKEKETSEIRNEQSVILKRIEESTEKAKNLTEQDKELEARENAALDARIRAQDIYNSKLEVYNAITLPEGIVPEENMEEVASIYDFPTQEKEISEETGYAYTKAA